MNEEMTPHISKGAYKSAIEEVRAAACPRKEGKPTTLRELARNIIDALAHHRRNCRDAKCIGQGMDCFECQDCDEQLVEIAVEVMRTVNQKGSR